MSAEGRATAEGIRDASPTGAPSTGVVVVMGVAGTGKTTVGALLAEALEVPYAEADAFHPAANVAKMTAGTPLDDGDRAPWLDAIGGWAAARRGLGGVVSCSALKRAYRDRLRTAAPDVFFLHLTGDRSLIARRMEQRPGHFMPPSLLESQFATLEPLQADERGAAVPVRLDPRTVTERALAVIRGRSPESTPGTPRASAECGPLQGPYAPGDAAHRAVARDEREPARYRTRQCE